MSPDHTTELYLLGGFALVRDGRSVALPRSVQRLLALLALTGARSRARVAGTLWPDVPDRKALANVRTAIWRAQRAGLQLTTPRGELLRLPPEVRIDVQDPHRAAAAAWPRTPELLPGWSEDWVQPQREVVRQRMMCALEEAAGEAIRQGDPRRGLDLALAVVRAGPLRESAHRLVVRAHLATGNTIAAHRHFERVRKLLRQELDIAPTPRFWRLVADDAGPTS